MADQQPARGTPPDANLLRCRDFTAWSLPRARFVGAYRTGDGRWEVLHLGLGGLHERHGAHPTREAAEAEAQALATVLAAAAVVAT